MKNNVKFLMIGAIMAISVSACKKDTPLPDVNEEELITTLTLKFTNTANSSDVRVFTSKDLDGDGGNPPQNQTITLAANSTYNVELTELLNETTNPAGNILAEVEEESDEHLFVYKPTGNLTINVTDKDANNLPVGIKSSAVTTSAGNASLTVILRHQPDGAKNGTETPGETDTERLFNVTIQ